MGSFLTATSTLFGFALLFWFWTWFTCSYGNNNWFRASGWLKKIFSFLELIWLILSFWKLHSVADKVSQKNITSKNLTSDSYDTSFRYFCAGAKLKVRCVRFLPKKLYLYYLSSIMVLVCDMTFVQSRIHIIDYTCFCTCWDRRLIFRYKMYFLHYWLFAGLGIFALYLW